MHPKLIELEKKFNTSILTSISTRLLEQKKIELWIKRDDLIDPIISGNKWRKLKYILDNALSIGSHTIISMGGAYSNHLHALAYIGDQLGLKTIGLIRGEKPEIFSSTLLEIQNWGMELRFIERTKFRKLRTYKQHNQLPGIEKNQYWIPEGGATALALLGVKEMVSEITMEYDVICLPCGTGTTFAGVIESIPEKCSVYGFSVLKGANFLVKDVENLLHKPKKDKVDWTIWLNYHFGGFAKQNKELIMFMENFVAQHSIELERVYTGKMFYGLFDLIQRDTFKPGQKIVAIHTGGLQGKRNE